MEMKDTILSRTVEKRLACLQDASGEIPFANLEMRSVESVRRENLKGFVWISWETVCISGGSIRP